MKSHVSDLLELAICVYKDAVAKCTANQLDLRDVNTITSRVKHEGLSFLTITLPDFGKDFEKSLSQGRIDSTQFRAFRKRGKIPAFLQGFFSQVFDKSTGGIHDECDIAVIEGIRQVAYTFKKLKLSCTPERASKAVLDYIACERDLEEPLPPELEENFLQVSSKLWNTLFDRFTIDNCIPKHGPGSTAEGISGNRKYQFRRWHERLEPFFPYFHNAVSSESAYVSREFKNVSFIPEEQEQPVKVIFVPKTLKTPRVIAMEPVCMQYTQQALSRYLVKCLESFRLTRGHVNFTDQTVNQKLALTSSKDGLMATLDLSSASDRVPWSLAIRMFDGNLDLKDAINACRSRRAKLPTGEVIHLKKFASMGSALCFPVESMYFYTLCVGALLKKHDLPVTSYYVEKYSKRVFVYGDDIIVPANDAVEVAAYLQKYYCKVGLHKSFWTGKFRESCGMDAYSGEVVTPTYIRNLPPSNLRDSSSLVSWVKTSNLFYKRGYWLTSTHLVNKCEAIMGELPIVGPDCAGLGKISYQPVCSIRRWSKRYQYFETKCWVARPIYRTDKLAGYPALLKSLLLLATSKDGDILAADNHLEKSVRHGAVALKRQWVRPY